LAKQIKELERDVKPWQPKILDVAVSYGDGGATAVQPLGQSFTYG